MQVPATSVSSWMTIASAPSGHRRAGEDAHGLALFDRAVEAAAGGGLADLLEGRRHRSHVFGPHGIAVHRRDRDRRLGHARSDVLGEYAAERVGDAHVFGGEARHAAQHLRLRLGDRDHGRAGRVHHAPV
jgi:hypothetical protein